MCFDWELSRDGVFFDGITHKKLIIGANLPALLTKIAPSHITSPKRTSAAVVIVGDSNSGFAYHPQIHVRIRGVFIMQCRAR